MAGNVVSFGLKGSPDIIGIVNDGRFLGIEIKTGSGVQTKEQKAFQAMIEKFGGIYFVVHSAKEAGELLCAKLSTR